MKMTFNRLITIIALIWFFIGFGTGIIEADIIGWVVSIGIATGASYTIYLYYAAHRNNNVEHSGNPPIIPNCPIHEQTGDSVFVGRCWFALDEGSVCPRHGDVKDACSHYLETGELMPEEVHRGHSFMSFYRPSQ